MEGGYHFMSTLIDSRVAEMRFDNRNFERNVATSMSTLDKLKEKLKLKDVATGLENITSAANKVTFSHIGNETDTVGVKFSAMQVAATTALVNLTNAAMQAGTSIANSLISAAKSGFQEYETQINAVQTILANTSSKGTTLEQVNNALDELNHYADMTIYNFTEMTRNIGTFTAAGVDLDTSVAAIKGIANLAAVSGSTSQQASTAMYQLSQALAAGTVKLQDWNSVVNAGMGGQVFQDALKETARVHGIAIDQMIKDEGSFRETLQKGWLSSEILTETLSKFTGDLTEEQLTSMGYTAEQAQEIMKLGQTANDAATKVKTFTQLIDTLKEANQSGWTQTWEILIGDFEEAKSLWTSVSDQLGNMIQQSADARNNLLQGWKDSGGRTMIIDSVKNVFEGLVTILNSVKEAFTDVFPPITVEQLVKVTEKIKSLSEKFKISEEQANKLKSVFKGVFSILGIGVTIIKNVVSAIVQLFSHFTGLGDSVLNVSSSVGEWISKLHNSIKETNIFGNAINTVIGFVGGAIDRVKEFVSVLSDKIDIHGFKDIVDVLKNIWNMTSGVRASLANTIQGIGNAFKDAFHNGDIKSFLDIVNGGLLATVIVKIKKFISGIADSFDNSTSIIDHIKSIFGTVKDSLESLQKSVKADTLKKIAIAIGVLAASLLVLSMIDPKRLTSALVAITVLFGELMGAMAIFEKIAGKSKGALKSVGVMIAMSTSVLILASALKKISDLEWNQLAIGLTGILGLMAIVVSAAIAMGKYGKKLKSGAAQMVIMATALKILASVCGELSQYSWLELGKGLSGISGMLLAFAGFQFLMKQIKPTKLLRSATSLVIIGAALEIFADVCSKFGQMQWPDLGKTGAAIAGILAICAGFELLSGMSKKTLRSATSLVIIGAALEIFADVCSKFGQMQWPDLGKTGAAIAGILAICAGFELLSGMSKKTLRSATSLVIIGAALEIFADVCSKFGQMQWPDLGKAGAAIAGILAICAGFELLSGMSGNILASSAALVIMATALNLMVPVLQSLGSMSVGEIVKGIVSIAATMAIIGVAGYALGPVAPVILAISGAVALLGVACLAAGAGVMAFATAFSILSTAGAVGAAAFVEALSVTITGILELIPSMVGVIAEAIVGICNAIILSAPAIGQAFKALLLEAINICVECIPALADGIFKIIVGVLETVKTYSPKIVTLLFDIFKSIAESAVEALGNISAESFITGIAAITAFMLALNAMTALAAGAMVGVLAFGAVVAELSLVIAALGALSQIPGLEWLISEGGDFLQIIGTAIGQFIGGIAGGFLDGTTSALPEMASNLSMFMTNLSPFIEGAKNIDGSVLSNIQTLTNTILALTGAGLLESITSWLTGESSFAQFGTQLKVFGEAIKGYGDTVSGIDTSGIEASVAAGKALSELAKTLPNSGGLAGMLAGNNDIGDFGEQLKTYGKAIKDYGDTVSGIDVSGVESSVAAGKLLMELAKTLPNSGGLAGMLAGNNDIGDFGTQIISFGNAIKNYGDIVSGINTGGIEASVNAGKMLAELVNDTSGVDSLQNYGDSLKSFGENLMIFVNDISGADFSGLYNSLSSLNTAFASAGTQGINDFVNSLISASGNISQAVSSIVESAASALRSRMGEFQSSGANLGNSLATGIVSSSATVMSAINNMASAGINSANNQVGGYRAAGYNMALGLASGISSGSSSAIAAAVSLAKSSLAAAKEALGIHSPSRAFMAIGRYIGEGLANGIRDNAYRAVDETEASAAKVKSVAKKSFDDVEKWVEEAKSFDELSLAEELEIWDTMISKYSEGSEERLKAEKNAYAVLKELREEDYQNSKDWIDKEKDYNRMSTKEELEAWKRVQERYIEGTDERAEIDKKIYDLKHELIDGDVYALEREIQANDDLIASLEEGTVAYSNAVKEGIYLRKLLKDAEYSTSKNWIETEKDYNRLDTKGELEAWERVQARYEDGSEERIEIDKKIYDLKHELIDGNIDALEDEIEANKRLIATLEEGSVAWSNAVKEGEYLNKLLVDANYQNSMDWIQDQEDRGEYSLADKLAWNTRMLNKYGKRDKETRKKYEKEIYATQKEIYNAYKDFLDDCQNVKDDYVEKEKELNEKLEQDIKELEDNYSDTLDSRIQSLYNAYGLFDKVEQKGKTSVSELTKNLQDQVAEFEDWDDTLQQLSKRGLNQALIEELQEMGPSAIANIRGLNSMTDAQLSQYANLWAEKHKEATDRATDELTDLRKETNSQIKELKTTYNSDLDELKKDTDEKLSELKDAFLKNIGAIKDDTEEKFQEIVSIASTVLGSAGWDELGEYMVDGLIEGVESKQPEFLKTLESLISAGTEITQDTAEIHSPSRVFARIGEYMVEGLIGGITNRSDDASKASADMARGTIQSVSRLISDMSTIIDSDMEITPTISPILDMTNVQNGLNQMDSTLSANRSIALGMSVVSKNQNGLAYQFGDAISKLADANTQSNGQIVDAIDGLKSDLSDLVDRVSQLQVVMDTGELVGAISPEMDRSLGVAAMMKRRGNI
jgi:tape measure domain-containing protein